MKLYEIDQALENCLDTETGEILDLGALEALTMERDRKIEGVALAIKNLQSDVAEIKLEEKALAERRTAKEHKVERLKAFLTDYLAGQKFETPRVRLSWRSSQKTVVTDERLLMSNIESMMLQGCLTYAAPKVNMTELGKLLKNGRCIPGAQIEKRSNLQIK